MGVKVSIVIAVRNEGRNLTKVIPTLVKQHYPVKDYEIIFADGKSEDNTRDIIREWQKKSKVKITLLNNQHQESGSGRNIGIKKAKGKYIMQLSGHTLVAPNLLKILTKKLDSQPTNVAGVGCRHKDPADSTDFQKAVGKILYSRVGGIGTSQSQDEKDNFVESVSFTLYRKKALLDVGLNDPKFRIGQDAELNIKLRKDGYKLLYTPQTYVEQYKRPSYTGLAKQMFWYGWARTKMIEKHHYSFKPVYLVPASMVLFFVTLSILSCMFPIAKQLLLAGFVIYVAPIIYSCTKIAKNANEGIVMFVGYMVVHFSYGLGLLWGILF